MDVSKAKTDPHNAADSAPSSAAPHPGAPATGAAATQVTWDDAAMQSSYANVINVINTREEFSLFFGQNQTWDLASEQGLVVKLGNRIVLSPYAVKRLHILLGDRLDAYEKRFGVLNVTS